MQHTKLAIVSAILGLILSLPATAEIYKCKTAKGQTIYSSTKCAQTAEIFIPKVGPQVNLFAIKNDTSKKTPTKPVVDIYITSWCPYCKKAMAYLRSKNIAFNSYDIEKDSLAKAKKQQLDPNYSGIPLTVINGQLLKGFSESRFELALQQK
ncbi:MAG: DUF4124 domain-containing protein [Methylomarinum sp.]|nr:DUF4124 domain-containing protein [Methylomarinum sp.]